MTVKEIVKEYLEKNGYDGLFYPGECACKNDDLMICEDVECLDCEAGYLTTVPEGSEYEFIISKNKENHTPETGIKD